MELIRIFAKIILYTALNIRICKAFILLVFKFSAKPLLFKWGFRSFTNKNHDSIFNRSSSSSNCRFSYSSRSVN